MKKACIIIPTYNERENLKKLIPSLMDVSKNIKNYKTHITVCDDNSPDGTAQLVTDLAKEHKNLHILLGPKHGLGVAYQRGFRYAMQHNFDVIVMMDADLSHPPSLLPRMLAEIDKGYDFVIGSRYIPGGATPDWSLRRRLISFTGNFFARIVGGMYSVHDCTSGYRALRVDKLRKINFRDLATRGYAFMTTLLYEMYMSGAKIKEVPLIFYDRKIGQTKLKPRDMVEFFINSFRLRIKTYRRSKK